MLSKVIHSHLDNIDEIVARAQEDIDKILEAIDRKELINNPHAALQDAVDTIKKLLEEKYIPMAAKDGFDLLKLLNKYDVEGKDIPIDPSKDPNKNEALAQ